MPRKPRRAADVGEVEGLLAEAFRYMYSVVGQMSRTAKGHFASEFELVVLLALARLRDEAYGVTVRREIEGRGGRPVSIGAVYATLARLAEKGLVESELSAPVAVRGGRSRRYYRLTAAGEHVLARSLRLLDRMAEGLDLAGAAGEGAR